MLGGRPLSQNEGESMEKEKVPQKVKYLGGEWEGEPSVIKGKTYKCLGIEDGWYRIIDEEDEDYLYPAREFEAVE